MSARPLPPELRQLLMDVILRTFGHSRYTQDSPLRPDVWMQWWEALAQGDDATVDLILAPADGCPAGRVAVALEALLADAPGQLNDTADARAKVRRNACIAYSRTTVQARLSPAETLTAAIAMSAWWDRRMTETADASGRLGQRALDRIANWRETGDSSVTVDQAISVNKASFQFYRFAALASLTMLLQEKPDLETLEKIARQLRDGRTPLKHLLETLGQYLARVLHEIDTKKSLLDTFEKANPGPESRIHAAAVNRTAGNAVYRSRKTVKADATHTLFRIDTTGIVWAVIDAGIDARHPAFLAHPRPDTDARRPRRTQKPPRVWHHATRIKATYDLTFLRDLLSTSAYPDTPPELMDDPNRPDAATTAQSWKAFVDTMEKDHAPLLEQLRLRRAVGMDIGWDILAPLVRIPHNDLYRPPLHEHGTHVAGILAGGWIEDQGPTFADTDEPGMMGICPEMLLVDIRAFDAQGCGREDTVIEAIELVRFMNRESGQPTIHGVNLSLSVTHDVQAYGCGQTPVCNACNELVRSGVTVVAAAGNSGHEGDASLGSHGQSARDISITDPGNAELVITVGSTHRQSPHTYGVSYFSSRGPTADGRLKPDLVAPGEKICGPIPLAGTVDEASYKILDGTSMAAPHVSGIAAMLMARNRELIGEPQRIKDILRRTATDLGRMPHFQGAGLVDALRALQSL